MIDKHVCLISGKDSAVTAGVLKELNPELDVEYITNITGFELPPFFDWIDRVSYFLEKPIKFIDGDLKSIISQQGILPSVRVRYCTRMSKIQPLEEYLSECGENPVNVYYGLRADEPFREGYTNRKSKAIIKPHYPLRDNHLTLPHVWHLAKKWDILPPAMIWHDILNQTIREMGEFSSIVDTLQEWHYRSLFSWRVREFNCYGCFFMRQYEFVGLLEHYPDLFYECADIEEDTGAEGFTLRQGYSLRDLANRKDEIKARRVKQIVKILYNLAQKRIFTDDHSDDILSVTSCGLLCGK